MKNYTLHIPMSGDFREYNTLASLRRYIRKHSKIITGRCVINGPKGFFEEITL